MSRRRKKWLKSRETWLGRTQIVVEVRAAQARRRLEARIERMAKILHAENRLRAALARVAVRRQLSR
jgi:hypothetical protein